MTNKEIIDKVMREIAVDSAGMDPGEYRLRMLELGNRALREASNVEEEFLGEELLSLAEKRRER